MAYVAQPDDEAVTIINATRHERVGAVSFVGLGGPIDVAATPDGRHLHVLLWRNLAVVDTASQVITDLKVFQLDENVPDRLAISPNGAFLFLFGRSHAIDITDLRTNSGTSILLGNPSAETGAMAVTFSRDSRFAYALRNDHDQDGNPIALVPIIDLVNLQVVNTLTLSGYASDLALSPDTRRVYVALNGSLAVLDATTGGTMATTTVSGRIDQLAINATGSLIYAAGDLLTKNEASGSDEVSGHFFSTIDAGTQQVINTVPIPDTPARVVPTLDEDTVYLLLGSRESTLSALDVATGAITAIIDGTAAGIALAPAPPSSPPPLPTPVRHPVMGSYRAYVGNGLSRTISVIDLMTNTLIDSIPLTDVTASSLTDMTIAPDGHLLYVLYRSGIVVAVDPISHQVIATFPAPLEDYTFSHIAITPDGRSLYVTCGDAFSVFVIDVATNHTATAIRGALNPDYDQTGIAMNPNGSTAYVVWTANRPFFRVGLISIIDTSTRSVSATLEAGVGTGTVQFSPDGALAYIAGRAGEGVTVFDTARREIHAIIPLGAGTNGISLSPTQPRLYLAINGDSSHGPSVSVVDTTADRLTGNIPLPAGANPTSIAMHPNGLFAYVALPDPVNALAVVETTTNTVTATIEVGQGPLAIAIGLAPGGAPTAQPTPNLTLAAIGGCAILGEFSAINNPAWLLPAWLLLWRRRERRLGVRYREWVTPRLGQ